LGSKNMIDPQTPVLIGVGQVTEKDPAVEQASSPLQLMEQATKLALDDAGISMDSLAQLDTVVVVKSFREPTRNSPEALANLFGATNTAQWLTPDGGNAPQYLVNRYSAAIANGEARFVLLSGAEAMATGRKIIKSGGKIAWSVPSDRDPQYLYAEHEMWSDHERAHGVWQASHVYPFFENALRHHYGHAIDEHQLIMGKLFSRLSEIAEQSAHAWFPTKRSPEEVATATSANRYVGWPYTKFMNAMNQINQSASVLLTSVEQARALGVDESRWVFLHGCSDTTDNWPITGRVNFHSSPSMKVMGERALAMANIHIDDIEHIDIYSCFPSAVQIARDELGISATDTRQLTVTGGLPFHGGAGNNYVMNSIAAMADKVREDRGSYGLVTANGGYIEKHAAGIYSTNPTQGHWQCESPNAYQPLIDNQTGPAFTEDPHGNANIETYSVVFGRSGGPETGMVIGRLGAIDDPTSTRFIATTPSEPYLLQAMTEDEFVGRSGFVRKQDGLNVFTPNL
jgi:acetyl-CoA C-acetyltransferase